MLQAALFSLAAVVILIPALAVQVPLSSTNRQQDEGQRLRDEEWSLDKLPNQNDTDHLVFETVYSLLQHWPNTRMRNGCNIVPGRISKGTLLYHGTTSNELPPGPEWVATDPEHSYLFCRGFSRHFQQGCWHLTLATTRSLKVIYFDGSSAVKLPYGSMDTQDLLAWGVSGGHDPHNERQRIQDLCKWGKNFGVDGFVRMEMDFELMLCDFVSGVAVVSFANLVSRGPNRPVVECTALSIRLLTRKHLRRHLTANVFSFEVMNAGSWHNRFPGETRVKLDLAGLVSFYDTQLAPSLVDIRAGQERWDHRVRNISSEDWSRAKSRVEAMLVRPEGVSSGVDWITLVQVVVDRHAGRLELMRYFLSSPVTGPDELLDLANKTQTQLRIMLTPYLLFSAGPASRLDRGDMNWTIPIYKLCATTHTYSMESELESMTDSEKLLLQAVRGTTREICRVVTKMWAAGIYAGIDLSSGTKDSPSVVEVTRLLKTWAEDLDGLMGWLDWSVWVKCDPGCGSEEMCWLPTWPVGFPRTHRPPPPPPDPEGLTSLDFRAMVMERLADEVELIVKPGPDDWVRPEPRCIRRVAPYDI